MQVESDGVRAESIRKSDTPTNNSANYIKVWGVARSCVLTSGVADIRYDPSLMFIRAYTKYVS